MDNVFTNDEIIEKLKGLEKSLLKRVFGDFYCDSLRTYNRHLGGKNRELVLQNNAKFF